MIFPVCLSLSLFFSRCMPSQDRWTALHFAADHDNVEVVKELMAQGCAVDATNLVRECVREEGCENMHSRGRTGPECVEVDNGVEGARGTRGIISCGR